MAEKIQKVLVDVPEASEMLSLAASTVWLLVRRGILPSVLVGKRRLISTAEIQKFAERGCGKISEQYANGMREREK